MHDTLSALLVLAVGALLSLNIWIVKTLLVVKTVLMGPEGENGIRSDVRALRKWRHEDAVPRFQRIASRLWRLETHANLPPIGETE